MEHHANLDLSPGTKSVEIEPGGNMDRKDLALTAGRISGNCAQTDMHNSNKRFKRFVSSQGIHFRQFVIRSDASQVVYA